SSLRALVAKLQRMLFGRSSEKSREKIEKKIARAETRITELQNRLGEAQLQLTSMAGETAPKTSDSPVRKALPATLPRDRQVISPAETECPVCSGKLKPLGESISEQLDIINTAFRVIETVRPKLACSRCDCIVQAPQPPKPIERSYASPALLARIIMAKFAEHLPLYRQSEIYARQGVELHRNTMGRWVDIMGEQLRPLYDELKHYVLMAGKVHADDTPVNVLEPGQGKTRTGRLWVYVRDDRNAGS
ncbi:TPA: IS66 family transposase, partial [Escherichia coli]